MSNITRFALVLLTGMPIVIVSQTPTLGQSRTVQPAPVRQPAQNTGSNKGIILQNQGPQNTTSNKGIILQNSAVQGGTAARTTSKKLPPNPCKPGQKACKN